MLRLLMHVCVCVCVYIDGRETVDNTQCDALLLLLVSRPDDEADFSVTGQWADRHAIYATRINTIIGSCATAASGQDCSCWYCSVSYTHLTLPTKRIV